MLRFSVTLIILTFCSVSGSFVCTNDSICFGTSTCGSGGACICSFPYFGERCQLKNCSTPCFNRTCDLSSGMCGCPAPRYGNACQFIGRYCPAQCLNGGVCNYTNGLCLCSTGYSGNICQNKLCVPACQNGGICQPTGECRCINGTQGDSCQFQFREINLLRFPVIFGVSVGLIGLCCCVISYTISILFVQTICSLRRRSRRKKESFENSHQLPGPRNNSSIRTINHVPRLPTVLLEDAIVEESPPPVPTRNPLINGDYCDSFENLAGIDTGNTEMIAYIDPETLSTSPNRTYSTLFDDPYGDEHCFTNPNTFNRASFQAAIHQNDEKRGSQSEVKSKPSLPPKPKIKFGGSEIHRNSHLLSKDENIIYEAMEGEDKELYNKYSILNSTDKIDEQCVVLSQEERNSLPRGGNINPPRPKSRRHKIKTRYFKENPIYNEPSSSLDKLFDQMSALNFREINPDTLIISDHLGMGEFGIVYKGTWISKIGEVPVALKMLKEKSDEAKKIVLFQEAIIMGQFSHPNILRILGIVSNKEPFSIVSELMKMGMLDFLHMVRNSELDVNKFPPLLLRFCREIAAGMQYLSSKKFVHRDLAARNILIANNYTCRIADFGMAREIINNSDYYSSTGGNIPIRWTAPEALFHQMYSEKSDVWSFGMTIFEIWSFGLNPWYNLNNEEVIRAIHSKCVHPPPAGCPRDIYFVMVEALKHDPKKRCIFTQFRQMLEAPIVLSRPETGTEADIPGNDPEYAKNLYMDLQTKYS